MAVWALRVGYVALSIAIAGLILMLWGSTPWVLAVGLLAWLAVAAVTLTGVLWARHELPEPRPGFWSMRFMLIDDTIHALTSPNDADGYLRRGEIRPGEHNDRPQ